MVILVVAAMLPALFAGEALAAESSNGCFIVELWDGSGYKQVADISFGQFQKESGVFIGIAENPKIRIRKEAEGLAFLDSVLLDGAAASGSDKLKKTDFDVLEITNEGVELLFAGSFGGNLSLTGRIEPKDVGGYPFMLPTVNLFIEDPAELKEFFTYEIGSNIGSVTADGQYEDLGEPFETEYLKPDTGHPDGYAYIYVFNDNEYLYAAADFTSDNTYDYGDDFFKVFVKQGDAVKEFKQTSSGHEYGAGAMQYTDKVEYEHMYYEVRIPLDSLGGRDELQLAFSLYGTSATNPPEDEPEIKTYSVFYHPNGGSGTVPLDMNKYYPGDKVTLLPGDGLVKPGYTFAGWALQDDTGVSSPYTMGSRDVTFFAVWSAVPKIPKTDDEAEAAGFVMLILGIALLAGLWIRKHKFS